MRLYQRKSFDTASCLFLLLNSEIEPLGSAFFINVPVKRVVACRFMRYSRLYFIQLNKVWHFIDFSTKISFIVQGIENHFIYFLHLRQRKLFGQKFENQRLMQQIVSEFFKSFAKYLVVIEH